MTKIIDAHSHFIPPEIAANTTFFKQYWSDLDSQLSMMDQLSIEKAWLFYPTTDAHLRMGGWSRVCRIYNEEIASVVRRHPDRFVGAGILPVDRPLEIPVELERIHGLGLKLISLASSYEGCYLDHEKFFPVYDFCSKRNIPIHIHPQILQPIGEERVADPLLTPVLEYVFDVSISIGKMLMAGIFERFHKVSFIFAHFGGVIPFVKERFDNTYLMLRKRNYVKDLGQLPSSCFRGLFLETSGSKSAGCLHTALEVVDAEHVLFGSDFPANQNIKDSVKVICNSNLNNSQSSAILYGTAAKLLSNLV